MVLKNLFTGQQWKTRHRDRLMDMRRREERVRCIERVTWKHITIGKIENQQEFTVWLRRWEGLVGVLNLFLLQCPILGYIICLFEFSDLITFQFSPVQFSHSIVSDSLQPHERQHTRPCCPSPTSGVYPNSYPLSRWCHPTISSSPPALNLSQHQGLFQWVVSSHQVAKVLEFQLQHQSFQWTPRTDFL